MLTYPDKISIEDYPVCYNMPDGKLAKSEDGEFLIHDPNTYKLPQMKNPQFNRLIKNRKMDREFPLSHISRIEGICAWCMEKLPNTKMGRPHPKRKWHKSCCLMAHGAFYPGRFGGIILARRDGMRCSYCRQEFYIHLKEKRLGNNFLNHTLYRGKLEDGQDTMPDIDHIVPIFKGGEGLGLDNLQLLCFMCHKRKSADEKK